MSNTILISGSSETISLTVQPQVAGVNLSISEAVGTNTVEINQFAGEYVSQLVAGDGIDISKTGTVSTISFVDDISSFETDPVFTASPAGSITSTQVSNWDIAYNDSITNISFNTDTGVLTATQLDAGELTTSLDGRYLQVSEFESNLGSITNQYLPKYDSTQDVFVDSKIYEETDKLIISTSNLDSTSAAQVEFGDGITTTYTLDGTFTAVEVSRDESVEYNRATAVYDTSDNKYYEVYQNSAFYFLPEYPNTPLNYISVSLAVYNNDGSKDSETVIFSDQSTYETISSSSIIKIEDNILFHYTHEVTDGNFERRLVLYNITGDETQTPVSLTSSYQQSPTIFDMYWSESLSKLFLLSTRQIFKYNIVNDALVFDEASSEDTSQPFYHTIFEHSGSVFVQSNYKLYPYNESENTFGTEIWSNSYIDDNGVSVRTGSTGDAVYIDGEVWSVSNETSDGVSYRYLTYYSFADDERYIIENLNPEASTEELTARIFYSEDQGLVYASMGVDVHIYDASTREKLETITLDPSNTFTPLEAIGSYSLYGGDHIYSLGKQSAIPSTFSNSATVKLDFAYGDYTQISGDSPVDPQSVLALIDQGLVYGAKSPTGISHHFFSNTVSTGDYERVLSIGPETLYVFNTAGENSTVTKTKIDNWDSAGPAIESAAFNTSTGNLTLTLTDDSTVVTNLDGRYLQTEENDFVTAASLASNVLTLTVSNQDDVTVDLSSLVVSDTNDFLTTASFADGTLTLGVSNQSDVTVSLDGRYLQSETTTSLSFADNTLTYTDEDGTANQIDLSIYEETNTSLSFNGETSVLTYTDEEGTDNNVDISSLEETLTSLSFSTETNALTYTDEDGTENAVDISSLEETLTSLSFSTETNSLTYTDEDGTENAVSIDALSETLTSISFTGDTLTYTDEDGTDTDIDLSKYNETLTSISFTGDTITYTDEDGTDTALDLSKYNETLTSLSFAGTTLTYTDEDGTDTAIDISSLSGDTTYDLASAANATDGADLKLTGSDTTTDTVNIVGTNAVTVTGAAGTITIDAPEETTTSLSYTSGSLTYTDEDGADTVLDISGLSGDTTYTVTATDNATDGVDVNLVGSDSSTDTLTVVGSGDVTVTQSSDTITIDAPHETTTSLSYANDTLTYTDEDGAATDIDLGGFNETLTSLSIATNVLTYTDENGTDTDIDLSLYLDDTNLARLTSGTLDGATGIATFTRDDATTFTVDFSDLLDDTDTDTTYDLSTKNNATAGIDLDLTAGGDGSGTDTVTFKGANAVTVTQASNVVTIDVPSGVNDFVDGATFNTADGVLTLSVSDQSDVTVDLDGRYLQSETDTLDSVATRGNTTDQSIKIGEDGGTPDTELHVVGAMTIEGDTAVSGTLTNVAISQNINSDLTSYSSGQDSFLSWTNSFDVADKTVYKKIAGTGIAQYFISSGSSGSDYDNYERHLQIDSSVTNPQFIRWDIGQWSGTGDTYKDISSTTGAAFSIGRFAGVGARTELFRLDVDGDLTISGGYGNQSSIRYKKNVQDLEDRTEDVMSLRPVRYELKDNDKKDIGFIAEEVAEIFPEVIGYKDGEVNSIDYSRLSVVLLQQVQKQQSLINVLEKRITKLENK